MFVSVLFALQKLNNMIINIEKPLKWPGSFLNFIYPKLKWLFIWWFAVLSNKNPWNRLKLTI